MWPIIFQLGPLTLYSFWLVAFVAFFMGIYLIWKRGRELHFDETILFNSLVVIGLWALLGARVAYILLHFREFGINIFGYVDVLSKPGWWFIGGIIGGIIAVIRQAKVNKWDVFSLTDVITPGLTLSQCLMTIGAFLNGSGAGMVSNTFMGVRFSGMYDKRLPVQLYDFGLLAILFIWLWWAEGAYRTFGWYKGSRSEAQSGFITAIYGIGYGLIEFGLSFLRPTGLLWGVMNLETLSALVITIMGIILLYKRADLDGLKKWHNNNGGSKKRNRRNEKVTPLTFGDDIFG
jgi:prolipoprotein diacylglyceryltransferase